MRKSICFLLLVIAFAISGMPGKSLAQSGNINLILGKRFLDEDDWEPIETQNEVGLEFDFKNAGWGVSLALDVLVSWDEQTERITIRDGFGNEITSFKADVKGYTVETDAGLRYIHERFPVKPFLGGGLSMVYAKAEVDIPGDKIDDSDIGVGLWVNGGVYATLFERVNLGFEGRWSSAEVDFDDFGNDTDAGGWHLGVLIGYHWGYHW